MFEIGAGEANIDGAPLPQSNSIRVDARAPISRPRRQRARRALTQVGLQVILDADFFNQLKLGFQPIDVLFLVFENLLE